MDIRGQHGSAGLNSARLHYLTTAVACAIIALASLPNCTPPQPFPILTWTPSLVHPPPPAPDALLPPTPSLPFKTHTYLAAIPLLAFGAPVTPCSLVQISWCGHYTLLRTRPVDRTGGWRRVCLPRSAARQIPAAAGVPTRRHTACTSARHHPSPSVAWRDRCLCYLFH